MAKINDGGPAFPVHIENCTDGNMVALGVLLPPGSTVDFQGMTLRDYFIAHAPAEPQPWFEPVMSPRPEFPAFTELSADDQRDWNSELYDYAPEECSAALRAYGEKRKAAEKAAREWDKECGKQRYIQWPAAWADAQLAAREAKS
ncbi:hypothetical protein [Cupriavidus gilardii]|uniref:hypothetical protein n=1 Tax=Cupriavidus gilardii TaxID=82541 RepID=UPI001572DC96|nr:hypothetical protein [Cupriavidus gilardii]NSX06045.1 hypothetical protein [Cupriavidus gilardii]